MADALRARGVKEGYAAWVAADNEQDLSGLARAALDQLRATLLELD